MERTCVVTGSASGIGRATAELMAARGARVVGVDRAGADVEADLATPEGRMRLAADVGAHIDGVVDAVICCAGVTGPGGMAVRVNHFGTVATLEALQPLLERGEQPRAAVVASHALIQPVDDELVALCLAGDEDAAVARAEAHPEAAALEYGSSKRALARWVRRSAPTERWAGAGIPLNAIAPGIVATPMTAGMLGTPEGREVLDELVPMPLSGPIPPAVVAEVLAWLVSPENAFVTGETIFVDGGSHTVLAGDDIWS